jgi:hypothetical protein
VQRGRDRPHDIIADETGHHEDGKDADEVH